MSDVGSDEELVRRFRAGERAAFEEIYRRYDRRLFGYLLLRTRDEHAAEDLLQEIFTGFLRYVIDAEVHAVRPFLFTSARNHAVNWGLRRRERHSALLSVFYAVVLGELIFGTLRMRTQRYLRSRQVAPGGSAPGAGTYVAVLLIPSLPILACFLAI